MVDSVNVSASTQYDDIASAYSQLYPPGGEINSTFPVSILESHQMFLAATNPTTSIKGRKVLDLACGAGHFTAKLASWGAESVTGLDISEGMLEAARTDAKKRGISEDKLKYIQGDASNVDIRIQGAPFDIVSSAWLLNYASDVATMKKMWTVIGNNLKPGGHFIGLTIQPLVTDQAFEGDMLNHLLKPDQTWGKHGNRGRVLEPLPGGSGYKMQWELGLPEEGHQIAKFETYHLHLKVFEESCAESDMFDGLDWRPFEVPEEAKSGRPTGFWNDIALLPYCRVVTARRRWW